MAATVKARALFDTSILTSAVVDSFRKLTPRRQVRNPVMFVVYMGSVLTTLLWLQALVGKGEAPGWFIFSVSVWLWFTVLFANFAEAMAEGRGKAQAASLRKARRDLQAKRLARPERGAGYELVPASALRKGHLVLVEAGDFIPADGTVVEGVASVNEAAITGESAPVIRESGGDRSSVTGGTQVLSDWLIVEVTANPGEAFLDRMISLVEGAKRQKTPNEIALDILLAAMTIIFLLATATLLPFSLYSVGAAGQGIPVTVTVLASLADETPEGRSIVVLAKEKYGIRERDVEKLGATFVAFTAQTRMSGVDLNGRKVRKGAADAIEPHVTQLGDAVPPEVRLTVDSISKAGATPLVVAAGARVLGSIQLKDIVKGGIRERFGELRRMGIKTVMITGDNPLTAAAIAAEAGIDDFLAEATPEAKLKLIRDVQAEGRLVAMTGDGTNDAPALAQADVAVAMSSGTQAAKEAGNMIDLDSNPTKLLEVVETGKQMLMTRGALTTFSIANDVAKYFAIIPAAFASTYPVLGALNVMHLATPNSAILSAVIFNALIIPALIPLALKGVKYRPVGAASILRRNMLIYGVGGILLPFVGIKAIDLLLVAMNLA